MSRRCDKTTSAIPDYYLWPLRRPRSHQTGLESADEYMWDMTETWPTTQEWVAWVRRRDGRKKYLRRSGWCYPVRPIVAAHTLPWSTLKLRDIPG